MKKLIVAAAIAIAALTMGCDPVLTQTWYAVSGGETGGVASFFDDFEGRISIARSDIDYAIGSYVDATKPLITTDWSVSGSNSVKIGYSLDGTAVDNGLRFKVNGSQACGLSFKANKSVLHVYMDGTTLLPITPVGTSAPYTYLTMAITPGWHLVEICTDVRSSTSFPEACLDDLKLFGYDPAVSVTPANGSLIDSVPTLIDWSDVKEASSYNFRVYSITPNGRTSFASVTSIASSQYSSSTMVQGNAYEWELDVNYGAACAKNFAVGSFASAKTVSLGTEYTGYDFPALLGGSSRPSSSYSSDITNRVAGFGVPSADPARMDLAVNVPQACRMLLLQLATADSLIVEAGSGGTWAPLATRKSIAGPIFSSGSRLLYGDVDLSSGVNRLRIRQATSGSEARSLFSLCYAAESTSLANSTFETTTDKGPFIGLTSYSTTSQSTAYAHAGTYSMRYNADHEAIFYNPLNLAVAKTMTLYARSHYSSSDKLWINGTGYSLSSTAWTKIDVSLPAGKSLMTMYCPYDLWYVYIDDISFN